MEQNTEFYPLAFRFTHAERDTLKMVAPRWDVLQTAVLRVLMDEAERGGLEPKITFVKSSQSKNEPNDSSR